MNDNERTIDAILARLFITTYKIEERIVSKESGYDLSISEIHALREIGPGHDTTITQAAKGLKISVSALTIAMSKLVAKGYVERTKDQSDKRIVKLSLTKVGREALKKHDDFHKGMVDAALDSLTENEKKVLEKSLAKVDEFFINQWVKFENE